MESLVGVELFGRHDGHHPHIVALDFDRNDPGIRAFIRERRELRNEYTKKCVERGIRLGFIHDFTWNDVLDYVHDGAWICINHVIDAMKYKKVMSPEDDGAELRQNVFKGESLAFEPPGPPVEQTIRTIRRAGGIAVLAHPNNKTHYVPELIEYGLNGIEVSHPDITSETERLAVEAAKAFRLYRSGGTDHTGAMSCCGGKNAIPALQGIDEEDFYMIKERKLG